MYKLQRVLNLAAWIVLNTRKFDRVLTHFWRSRLHWLDVVDQVWFRVFVQMSAQDGFWIPVYLLPTRLRHLWPSPPPIGWPWSCISCNVSSTRQHESSRTRTSLTGDSLISGEVTYAGWTLLTGFGSEFAFRCLHKMAPEYLSTYCQPVSGISGYRHLRSADRCHLDIPRVKLALYAGHSFAYAGPSNWNSLPAYLTDSSLSLSSFKCHLKTFDGGITGSRLSWSILI